VSDSQVVLFGAGGYAKEAFGALDKKYSPVAYGDNDTKKHGTSFMGLPVMSLRQVETDFPDCRYYITVNIATKPYVTESLVQGGVAPSRIINFEEYKRYKSCWLLETHLRHFLTKDFRALLFCCSDFGKNASPRTNIHYGAHDITIQEFFATRDRIVEELNSSTKVSPDNTCFGCSGISDGLWCTNRRILVFNPVHRMICNFKCSYCQSPNEHIDNSFFSDTEESLSFLHYIIEKNIIGIDTEIHLMAGELSIHPLQDAILSAVQNHPCLILTNARGISQLTSQENLAKLVHGGEPCARLRFQRSS